MTAASWDEEEASPGAQQVRDAAARLAVRLVGWKH